MLLLCHATKNLQNRKIHQVWQQYICQVSSYQFLPCKTSEFMMGRATWVSANDTILLITGVVSFFGERSFFAERSSVEVSCTMETFTDKNKKISYKPGRINQKVLFNNKCFNKQCKYLIALGIAGYCSNFLLGLKDSQFL